jgi:hypothetical protein
MNVLWLNPIVWLGVLTVAIPLLIHLLTKQQTRRTPFPTLRFLHATRLAALRRRAIENWPLLLVRALMLVAATAALAAPLFVSDARKEQWGRRVARALVVAPGAQADVDQLIESERQASYVSEVFRPAERVADGLRDAALWLETQPPAVREVVVLGDLRRGALAPADLSIVPSHAGLRFLPVSSDQRAANATRFFQINGVRWRADVVLEESATRVAYVREGSAASPLEIRTSPEDAAQAKAALDALVQRGFDLGAHPERRVVVVFEGGGLEGLRVTEPPAASWMRTALAKLPGMSGAAAGETLVVRVPERASVDRALESLEAVLRSVFSDDTPVVEEPARIPPAQLAQWSRPPGSADERHLQDEGDRRGLWGVVLVLMAIETLLRRSRQAEAERPLEDARVA